MRFCAGSQSCSRLQILLFHFLSIFGFLKLVFELLVRLENFFKLAAKLVLLTVNLVALVIKRFILLRGDSYDIRQVLNHFAQLRHIVEMLRLHIFDEVAVLLHLAEQLYRSVKLIICRPAHQSHVIVGDLNDLIV